MAREDVAALTAGQTLRLSGHWREHPKYGPQFQVVRAQETKPATLTGLEKYLGSVRYGTTVPGAGYPLWRVFLAEGSLTFLLVFSIFLFVSSHRLMRWTPLMVWMLVAMMVWLESPISGTSLNPARSFGPALVSWFWDDHWLYWVAPLLGALLVVGAFRLLSGGARDVLTGKVFHVAYSRSVFMNVSAPCMLVYGKLRKTPRAVAVLEGES